MVEGVEGGVWTEEGDGGGSRAGGLSAAGGPTAAGDEEEGLRGSDTGDLRMEACTVLATLTTSGLHVAAESLLGSVVVGLRPTVKVLAGFVVAGGPTLGLLVLLRAKRPPAAAPIRWLCSWSKAKSSRRCVRANFCWIAMRRRELRVFFSSSAAASCLCISSSWVTYSSHLRRAESWHYDVLKRPYLKNFIP